ncbi:uncharacterized protein LOC116927234 [Daphnia magna]|uniref:uncharacterized protein LOC116927234 n=1 Tax=Daphnia magna TaxID=35525 RepID=UPI001E1BAA3A|nr:uncharacterized protein LOC116927234 [Daphnia magna]
MKCKDRTHVSSQRPELKSGALTTRPTWCLLIHPPSSELRCLFSSSNQRIQLWCEDRTHVSIQRPELKSGALTARPTWCEDRTHVSSQRPELKSGALTTRPTWYWNSSYHEFPTRSSFFFF